MGAKSSAPRRGAFKQWWLRSPSAPSPAKASAELIEHEENILAGPHGTIDGIRKLLWLADAGRASYTAADRSSRLPGGDANFDEKGDYQNPKGEIADYWDFDEDTHDRKKK